MRVKCLTGISHGAQDAKKGDHITVSEKDGKELIEKGLAEPADSTDVDPAHNTSTDRVVHHEGGPIQGKDGSPLIHNQSVPGAPENK
jgi:hypothetical protein